MMKNLKSSQGFTLMETLLAATLFAVVMVSGMGVFSMGLQIKSRMQGHSILERKALLSLEKIGRDLRSAIQLPSEKESIQKSEIEYAGDAREFSIPAVVTKAGKEGPLVTQIGRITYRFDASSRSICKKIENATDLYLKNNVSCQSIANEIQSLKFRYWVFDKIGKDYDWESEWDSKDGLPKAIDVTFVLNVKPSRNQSANPKKYQQAWVLPVGGGGAS